MKKKRATTKSRIIAERLEPRVLYSADPLGLAVGALLFNDQHIHDTAVAYEPFSQINITEPLASDTSAQVELIFIDIRADSSLNDMQALLAQEHSSAIVHVVDSQFGGIDSISTIIAEYKSVSSIHFLAHSDSEGLRLGNDWLDINTVGEFKSQLSGWQNSLTDGADVLLYGCDLTAGSDGLNLIEQLAAYTGADVAASNNTTGHASLNGDWELEESIGAIETRSLGSDRVSQEWNNSLALIVVDTSNDIVDAGDGVTSLREAITESNNSIGIVDEIQLQASVTPYSVTAGSLNITDAVILSGAADGSTVLDAEGNNRILDIFGADVQITNVELTNGQATGDGGAIRIQGGTTTLDDVEFTNNIASGFSGGAISVAAGDLTISNSSFINNQATIGLGGAIHMQGNGSLDIVNSAFSGNDADGNGGAGGGLGGAIALLGQSNANLTSNYIHDNTSWDHGGGLYSTTTGTLSIASTTVESNISSGEGGGVYVLNDVTIRSSTFSTNTAQFGGGGLTVAGGNAVVDHSTFTLNEVVFSAGPTIGQAIDVGATATLSIGSSIIADNIANSRPDVSGDGTITSTGFNLLTETLTEFDKPTDINGGTANLGALSSVGGRAPTHTPQAGSDAIDTGNTRLGTDANGATVNTFSDIGAVEADPTASGTKVFWADSNGWIYRANEDGTGIQQIYQTDNPPGDIEYDPGTDRIFWTETDGQWGSLRSTDINGNDLQDITSSVIGDRLMSPTGIAIDAVGRYLYVHADVVLSPANAILGTENKIDRYIINNDGSLIWDSEIYSGSPFSNPEPQISKPIDLEYTPNLDGREALVWNDAGNPAGVLPETVPQINIWDLTPGPNTNPQPAIVPTGTYDPRGLAIDPVSGTVYFGTVNNNVASFTHDLDTQVTTYVDSASDEFLFGMQFDTSTDTLWWTEIDGGTGNLGIFLTSLSTFEYKITYSGSPVALALAEITPSTAFPTIDVNTGLGASDVSEGGVVTIDNSMLHAVDDLSSADDITFTLESLPSAGSLLLDGLTLNVGDGFTQAMIDGTAVGGPLQYQHDGTENLTDEFAVSVTDEVNGPNPELNTISVTVAPVSDFDPVANSDAIIVTEGTAISVLADGTTTSVLTNDTDADTDDTMSAAVKAGFDVQHGTLVLATDGTFTYTHDDSENLTDQFTYIVTDAGGRTSEATVTITINSINDNTPVLPGDQISLTEGATKTVFDSGRNNLLSGLIDADLNDSATISIVTFPAFGSITISADDTFSYTHNGSEERQDSFSYIAIDSSGNQSTTKLVNISISNVNDAPVINVPISNFNAIEREAFAASLPNNQFSDSDGDEWTIELSTAAGPLPGWLTFDPITQILTGTPGATDLGSTNIIMQARDSLGAVSAPQSFTITVGESTNADEIVVANNQVSENSMGAVIGPLTLNGQAISSAADVTISDSRFEFTDGNLALNPDSTIDYEAEPTIDLSISTTDEIGRVVSDVITLVVTDSNDVPVPDQIPVDTTVPESGALALPDNLFVDQDNDVLNITAQLQGGGALPEWLQFNPTDNSFSIDGTAQVSTLAVEIVADDLNGGINRLTILLQFGVPEAQPAEPETATEFENIATVTDTPTPEPTTEEGAPEEAPSTRETEAVSFTADGISDRIEFEHIDIASLIKPLSVIATDATTAGDFLNDVAANLPDTESKATNIELLQFDLVAAQELDRGLTSLADSFDQQRELLKEAYNQSRSAIGRSITLTSGLSVGYLLWLIRGGTLMGSVLSSMPAWRLVDPLPILGSLGDDTDDANDVDDSLETMVDIDN